MTKPFIKWAGGKASLIDIILPQLLATGRKTLVSPFLGGGAIELAWLEAVPDGKLIASDANWQLIATWNAVRDNVEELIDDLERLRTKQANLVSIAAGPEAEAYYKMRAGYNEMSRECDDVAVAAYFIYLNKTCFNGLHRVNSKGGFNAPFGKRAFTFDPDVLLAVSKLLNERDVSVEHYGFSQAIFCPVPQADSSIVYADPPYLGVFSSYTKEGFTEADHITLADTLKTAALFQGDVVFASNSVHAAPIYESRGFNVQRISARRRISCDGNRDDAAEILAVL